MCAPTHLTCAQAVMWVLGVARGRGSCFCALLEMFAVQGESLRDSVPSTGRAVDKSPSATAAAGSLVPLLLCPPESGGYRSHRDAHPPCIPHPPGCTEMQGQGQSAAAQPAHWERPRHSAARRLGGLASAFGGAWLRCPRSWVSGWAGGDGGCRHGRVPWERSPAGAGIRICRGGIVLTYLALVGSVCGAGGVRQLGGIRLREAQGIKGQEIQKLLS